MTNINFHPLYLSLYVAFITSIILLIISIPLAWWLSRSNYTITKKVIEILISLPLVLPPTVLGFYLLIILNPDAFFGKIWFFFTKADLVFSLSGIIVASVIYSIPFAVQPIQVVFRKINKEVIQQIYLLRMSKTHFFLKIVLPIARNGIISSIVLTFSHTLGEFGVILMIGGNIPGKTQVISVAIYESVEMLNYTTTHFLSSIVLFISFIILIILYKLRNLND